MIPKIEKNETWVSFLNHFLIKRKYDNIAMKLISYDKEGNSSDAITEKINERRVYSFNLDKIFNSESSCYQLEFFSSNNLFIPFPAVMVNHIGKYSINTVHSYNRVLNDMREEDKISEIEVKEASIDVAIKRDIDTFLILQSGIIDLKKESLELILSPSDQPHNQIIKNIEINMPKMSIKKINISSVYKEIEHCSAGRYVLKIKQPKQLLFYGRLLVGIENLESGSYSGNHSYYDNSEYAEYCKNTRIAYRSYPYFNNSKNQIRIYPILSPGTGKVSIFLNYMEDSTMKSFEVKNINFNNTKDLINEDIDILVSKNAKDLNIKSFSLVYESLGEAGPPTRVNHQLIYGEKSNCDINASINCSLIHDNEFYKPKNKKSFTWCQIINNESYDSKLGICFNDFLVKDNKEERAIELDIYGKEGLIETRQIKLKLLDSYILSPSSIKSQSKYIWVVAKCDEPNLRLTSFHINKMRGYSSGEHGF